MVAVIGMFLRLTRDPGMTDPENGTPVLPSHPLVVKDTCITAKGEATKKESRAAPSTFVERGRRPLREALLLRGESSCETRVTPETGLGSSKVEWTATLDYFWKVPHGMEEGVSLRHLSGLRGPSARDLWVGHRPGQARLWMGVGAIVAFAPTHRPSARDLCFRARRPIDSRARVHRSLSGEYMQVNTPYRRGPGTYLGPLSGSSSKSDSQHGPLVLMLPVRSFRF